MHAQERTQTHSELNTRLIPTDVSGIKAAVLHVSDAERAAQVLQSAGFAPQSFPGYVAVPVPFFFWLFFSCASHLMRERERVCVCVREGERVCVRERECVVPLSVREKRVRARERESS